MAFEEIAIRERRHNEEVKASVDGGKFQEALRLQEAHAAEIEKSELKREGKPGKATAEALGIVAWRSLFARDFGKALSATDRALLLSPDLLWIETNRAHALMFLGRTEEARTLYLVNKGKLVPTHGNRLWEQAIADDFAEFRKTKLTNPMMPEVESALGLPAR